MSFGETPPFDCAKARELKGGKGAIALIIARSGAKISRVLHVIITVALSRFLDFGFVDPKREISTVGKRF